MISYEDFLANADAEDIRVMNLLSQGQTISFNDGGEAEAMFQRIVRRVQSGHQFAQLRLVALSVHHQQQRSHRSGQLAPAVLDLLLAGIGLAIRSHDFHTSPYARSRGAPC